MIERAAVRGTKRRAMLRSALLENVRPPVSRPRVAIEAWLIRAIGSNDVNRDSFAHATERSTE